MSYIILGSFSCHKQMDSPTTLQSTGSDFLEKFPPLWSHFISTWPGLFQGQPANAVNFQAYMYITDGIVHCNTSRASGLIQGAEGPTEDI